MPLVLIAEPASPAAWADSASRVLLLRVRVVRACRVWLELRWMLLPMRADETACLRATDFSPVPSCSTASATGSLASTLAIAVASAVSSSWLGIEARAVSCLSVFVTRVLCAVPANALAIMGESVSGAFLPDCSMVSAALPLAFSSPTAASSGAWVKLGIYL